jgi:hypothetical protein
MIFYVRVTPLEATHFLFLLPAMVNTYTNGHRITDLFCQLTDLHEIWHAYSATKGKYTPPSHFLILGHQYYYISVVTVLTSRCEGH